MLYLVLIECRLVLAIQFVTDSRFSRPFKRIPIIEGLEEVLGIKLPCPTTYTEDSAQQFYEKLLVEKVR